MPGFKAQGLVYARVHGSWFSLYQGLQLMVLFKPGFTAQGLVYAKVHGSWFSLCQGLQLMV